MNELWPRDENQGLTSTLIDEVIRLALDGVPFVIVYCHDNRWCNHLGDIVMGVAMARNLHASRYDSRTIVVHDTEVGFERVSGPDRRRRTRGMISGDKPVELYDNSCVLV